MSEFQLTISKTRNPGYKRERVWGKSAMLSGPDTTSGCMIFIAIQNLRLASTIALDALHDVQSPDSASRNLDFMI